MLRASLPSPDLLAQHPRLQLLFSPFIAAIKSGNVKQYDEKLEWAQPRLVGMSIYLMVERAREGCLRVLFKKAYVHFHRTVPSSEKYQLIPINQVGSHPTRLQEYLCPRSRPR